jgi:hypothetical protein
MFERIDAVIGEAMQGAEMRERPAAGLDPVYHGPAAMKAIDAAIGAISGKTLKAKSASAVSVACQSLTDAIYAKMAFDFDSQDDQQIGITLLDFNTLEEIVDAQ